MEFKEILLTVVIVAGFIALTYGIKHLCEKYISGTNKYQKVGFGLGMYLSKKVMEAHQGDIYYTGNGTLNSFIIELPIKPKNDVSKIIW